MRRIDAVTLATHDMKRAVEFYARLGGECTFGGEGASFSTLDLGGTHLNLVLEPKRSRGAGGAGWSCSLTMWMRRSRSWWQTG